ncbi:retrovirus-related pol polyprotein from transposon TNT 1-94 [Tanacetum coccineum]
MYSNPHNQATIQDGRVTVQQIQGRQSQSYAGTGNRGITTTSKGNYAAGQPRVMKCYNCQGEGNMARQCTQPKRPRNTAWFKEKLMLAEAQEAGQILDEEQLEFLVDLRMDEALVPYTDSYPNDMLNQFVQEMPYSVQTHIVEYPDDEIHSDNNIIPYSQYLLESQNAEHVVISVIDDEKALILEEESRSKMLDKQNDPISIEKKIKISLIDYSKLNKIKEDFVEAPHELLKVSLVNESLKKLNYQLANFDKVVKNKTTSDAITTGAWGFEHIKACFVTEIIPFLKVLKDIFNAFDKTLLDEITKVQTIFNQMEAAVDQCSVEKTI